MKYLVKTSILILGLCSLMMTFSYVPYNVYSQTNAINISDYDLGFPIHDSQNSSVPSENVTSMSDSN